MAGIFLSYKKEDAPRARAIVDALRAEGFELWWDQGIGSGADWRSEIRNRISSANLVLVLWSTSSVQSDWVAEEAQWGKDRNVLLPALIDDVSPPIGFGGVQASNLVGWSGNRSDPAWRHYVESIRAKLSSSPMPERRPPRPRPSLFRMVTIGLGALAAILTIIATMEQFHVIDIVADPALVSRPQRQPNAQERSEWATVRAGRGCESIRQYVNQHPDGAFVADAQALLAARTSQTTAQWTPFTQAAPVVATSSIGTRSSEASACAEARALIARRAEQSCAIYSGADAFHRGIDTEVSDEQCTCRNDALVAGAPALWICTINATATCKGEVREDVSIEICG